jgi:hypothetical protein
MKKNEEATEVKKRGQKQDLRRYGGSNIYFAGNYSLLENAPLYYGGTKMRPLFNIKTGGGHARNH